jgi:hypothetical protein
MKYLPKLNCKKLQFVEINSLGYLLLKLVVTEVSPLGQDLRSSYFNYAQIHILPLCLLRVGATLGK